MARRSILFLTLLSLVAVGCPGQKPPQPPQSAKGREAEGPLVWKLSKSGLGFRLSNADDEADNPRERKATPSTPLGGEDARKIASRLPEVKRDPDDVQDFAMRAKSIPAPRPGKTVNETFPPPPAPPPTGTPPAGPLKVERHAPEGKVELAPYLTMTFTQPMVPVTSVDELKEHPPVQLVPEPAGKWRWLGTRTLMFQPDKRFPMATEYAVTVPAGTKAMNGQTLAAVEKWSFATPPPTMKQGHPQGGSEPRDPLLFVEFDQAIDAKTMLNSIELSGGRGAVPIRLAETDEIEANDGVRRLSQQAEKGRWLAIRPANRLPVATRFTAKIKTGAPSAEGPKVTDKEQSFSFNTYGAMRVSHHSCSTWRNGKETCSPLAPFSISFTNPVDMKVFDKSMVTVSPEIPGMKVEVHGSGMTIRGKTKGRTKYTVNIAGTIGDTHGQTMGEVATIPFDVGSAEPTMFGAEQEMIVLDPGQPRVSTGDELPKVAQKAKDYQVYTINEPGLRARVFAVGPDDWKKYLAFNQEWERPRKIAPPGRLVYDKVLTPKKAPDELVTTAIDLAPALAGGIGQALVVVEPTRTFPKGYTKPELHVWVQSTEIGLDAMIETDQITGWATRLADGAPMDGVDVQLLGAASAKTDAQGLARVPLSSTPGHLVVGRKGKDVVLVPERYYGEPTYMQMQHTDQVRWLVYDDRGMYKPGEEMRVKGWVRRVGMSRGGDLDAIPNIAGNTLGYRIRDPRGAEIGTGTATLDEHGSFDFAYKLPGNANLGHANVEMTLPTALSNSTANHAFQIQEFRRPEFEVTAKSTEGPQFVGKHAVTTLTAAYYSGGGLPDAAVNWNVTRSTTGFTPPNRSDYHFGPEPSFFWSWRSSIRKKNEPKSETWTAKTNPQGLHRLRIDFDAVEPSYPMKLDITGSVEDVNRQQWAGRTSMIVHPSNVYSGIKLAKNFIRAGENIETDVVIVDVDGKALGTKHAVVKASRIDWEQNGSEYEEKELDTQTCEVDAPASPSATSARGPESEKLHCSFKTREGGTWRVTSIVTDEHGRKNQTTTSLWVMGSDRPKDRGLERAKVNVVLDKKEYQPGELAEVLVVAPFAPAEAVLTLRRQGIVHVERFSMKSTSQTLKVKLDEPLVPNAEVRVDIVGQDFRDDAAGNRDERLPKRPAFAAGSMEARVLPTSRTLDVKANARRPTLEPGGSTQIDVDVKDAAGRAVSDAEVALIVADESVLALSGYKTPDPLAVFYSSRGSDVHEVGMRDRVLLGDPDLAQLRVAEGREDSGGFARGGMRAMGRHMDKSAAAPGAPPPPPMPALAATAMAEMSALAKPMADMKRPMEAADDAKQRSVVGETTTPMQVRTDFSALALFSPKVKTDRQGHASVPIKLPDNLTRYRVMAVAATRDTSFGSNESTITAKLPVMVRPSAPRFLNFGDKFELPVVIQNQTDQPIDVGIVARATNASIEEPSAKRVRIAGNDRAEVRFNASTDKPGTARFQFGVASGGFSDASQIELPVWTPATTEAFATYGEIDEGAMAQPVKMPPGVFPQFGGLEVTTSSTQLQALTDAVVYLYKYPFECNEQLASRVITIAALRDVLSAFKSKDLPPPAALEASMNGDFEKLKRRQHYTGGWGFWQEQPWPYLTIHVAHALARAKDKGYKPDEQMFQRALGYLRQIESHIPAWYGEEAKRAIVAYSIYVRNRMKDPDAAKARKLLAEAGGADKLGIEAVGWLWPTISEDKGSTAENEAIRRHVANRVTETAGSAHFVSGYKDADWVLLHSDRRADGVLLEAMIGDQKDSTVIPKLVKGLLGHRKAGRWTNTQENAFVLLALDRYFVTYEKVTPDFVARVWLGDKFAGDHAFKGRTTEFSHIGIPMAFLAKEKQKEQNLLIGKDGPGRLYYRVGMQYAPTDLKLPPADYGFVVSRLYEGADKPDDVKRDPDGTWRVKAGSKVRVRVSMVAPTRRYHVALVDPIPAGLEPMNPDLAVTGEIPKDPKAAEQKGGRYWYWQRTWYEHQNMRDERVEAFASLLWDGVWEYNYVARATTPGTFVVPPAKAEEMYSPETFGRSGGDRMIVE
jgi:alpha-2-macroglobulin